MGHGELFVTDIMVGTPVKLELPAGENLIYKPSRSIILSLIYDIIPTLTLPWIYRPDNWCCQGGACGFICTQSMHLCTHPMHNM